VDNVKGKEKPSEKGKKKATDKTPVWPEIKNAPVVVKKKPKKKK
jgi:hypothetical protein